MKIVIADDSAVIRAILDQNLNKYPEIEIVASVSNGRRAVQAAKSEHVDVVISDIDMPEMTGLEAASILSKELHIPSLILGESDSARIEAKRAGASEFVVKPKLDSYNFDFFDNLVATLKKISAEAPTCRSSSSDSEFCEVFQGKPKILCLGASTGGPSAVAEVLKGLGDNFPLPILYAQHIEVGADKPMAEWFSSVCHNIRVKLAENGEEAKAGNVYMAPAEKHLVIDYVKSNGNPILRLSDEAPERFLRPAVNKLFRSASKFYKTTCLAVLLTGMGRDGADGCKEVLDNGGWTIVEDKSTCAVFGMPAAAIEVGGAKEILPRGRIAKRIRELV
jgi:two-component system chemotaxis response regulator CheB